MSVYWAFLDTRTQLTARSTDAPFHACPRRSASALVAAVESLVRHVMEQLPSAVVLLVESYAWKDPDLNPTPLAYRAVALQYGIALVSYAAVARSASESWIAECDPEIKPCGNHPPWTTHAAVADALVVSMVALHRELEGARRIHADEALSRASLRRSRAAAPDGAATSEATTAAATATVGDGPPPINEASATDAGVEHDDAVILRQCLEEQVREGL